MKKITLVVSIIIIPLICSGYDWSEWGPAGVDANDFYVRETGFMYEVVCAQDGIYIWEDDGWDNYNYGMLPVITAIDHNEDDFLLIMGDGSYSDGIYTFDLNTYEFTVREWCVYPNFLKYCSSNGKYYTGYYYGMMESEDGINWSSISFFDNINCVDLVYHENHLVVSELSNIAEVYCSDDYGDNWTTVTGTPFIKEMLYDQPDLLYGVFPDFSNSSGIWYSQDHGYNWYSAIYSDNLNTITSDCAENIFVGWADFPVGEREGGVAWYNQTNMELVEMNTGLPCLAVNKLTTHDLIDCINIVACTQNGVFLLTNYEMDVDPQIPALSLCIYNSPNPFNPNTVFYLESQDPLYGMIEMFNIRGQLIKKLPVNSTAPTLSVSWDSSNSNNREVDSGIYFYRFRSSEKSTDLNKMALIR